MQRIGITCFFLILYVVALPATVTSTHSNTVQPEELARLSAKAAREGIVRIIIGLKLPPPGFSPEGFLSPGEVKQQREAITATREALLNSLSEYEIEVYAIYESIPYAAMKVGTDALKGLARSRYVKTIEKDSPKDLHETENAVEACEGADSKTESAGED